MERKEILPGEMRDVTVRPSEVPEQFHSRDVTLRQNLPIPDKYKPRPSEHQVSEGVPVAFRIVKDLTITPTMRVTENGAGTVSVEYAGEWFNDFNALMSRVWADAKAVADVRAELLGGEGKPLPLAKASDRMKQAAKSQQ